MVGSYSLGTLTSAISGWSVNEDSITTPTPSLLTFFPDMCQEEKVKTLSKEFASPYTKGMDVLEIAVGAFLRQTRLSLVRIPLESWVQTGILTKEIWVWGWRPNYDTQQSGKSSMGKMGSICHFPCALPASIWGHCSQVLVFTSIWGTQKGVWQWHFPCCFSQYLGILRLQNTVKHEKTQNDKSTLFSPPLHRGKSKRGTFENLVLMWSCMQRVGFRCPFLRGNSERENDSKGRKAMHMMSSVLDSDTETWEVTSRRLTLQNKGIQLWYTNVRPCDLRCSDVVHALSTESKSQFSALLSTGEVKYTRKRDLDSTSATHCNTILRWLGSTWRTFRIVSLYVMAHTSIGGQIVVKNVNFFPSLIAKNAQNLQPHFMRLQICFSHS